METNKNIEVEAKIGDLELFITNPMPFDQDLVAIKAAGGQLAIPQQVVQARRVADFKSSAWQRGSWIAANLVYAPGEDFVIWTLPSYSPIPKHPIEATEAHRAGKEYLIVEKEISELLEKAKSGKEQSVYVDKRTENFEIPVSKLHKDNLTKFLFKEDAQPYAGRLEEDGIENVPVWLVDSNHVKEQKAPFARALWLRGVDVRSGLGGDYGDLSYDFRARGVRPVDAKKIAAENVAKLSAYETIAQKYGIKSTDELQKVLEKYTKAREALQ
jgi:hypothetical protein